ncbi:MAG: hypothetical protein FWH14_05245 [Oscillospiraceae bacterium]|nr:hypothetical protein [Oscillospiraceae bacterium]
MRKAILHGLLGATLFFTAERIISFFWLIWEFSFYNLGSTIRLVDIKHLLFNETHLLLIYLSIYLLAGLLYGLCLARKTINIQKNTYITVFFICAVMQIIQWPILPYPVDHPGLLPVALLFAAPGGKYLSSYESFVSIISNPESWIALSFFVFASMIFVLGILIGEKRVRNKRMTELWIQETGE